MGASLKKARAFITAVGWTPRNLTDSADLRARFAPPPEQLNLL
jgi:predicted DNA-binding helix-hairpin-helix protein